jgi:hypothetical protein
MVQPQRMGGNEVTFEIRLKEQAEHEFDKDDVEEHQFKMNEACTGFVSEFIDCEGEVYYSTAMKAMNAVWQYERSVKDSAATMVGPEWDRDKGVVGKWRYPHLRKNNE